MPTLLWIIAVVLLVSLLLLLSLSMIMAASENAVTRITRSHVNNLIIHIQTDEHISTFVRTRQLANLRIIQRLITHRFSTAASCAFVRVTCHLINGVLISCIIALFSGDLRIQLCAAIICALPVAVVAVLMRPRLLADNQCVGFMRRYATLISWCVKLTPFIAWKRDATLTNSHDAQPVDEETLEKMQLEQGRAAIDRLAELNGLDVKVSEMLRNVLSLSETLAREIMVPRTDMICIEQHETLDAVLKLCSRSGFSRIPVIGEDVDDIVGMVYLKDVVRATSFNPSATTRRVDTICRKPVFIPESQHVDDLFHNMQRTRQHAAIVVDEYGGIAGLVTIEDALEQIVGELEDEHDRTQHTDPEQIDADTWRMPARTPITQLEDLFEVTIDEDEVDTVFGLFTKVLGSVPIVGSYAVAHGLRFTAVDCAGRRKKVATIIVERALQTDNDHAHPLIDSTLNEDHGA